MSKNPFDAFLDVYVDHLLDEPQSEPVQKAKPVQKAEPVHNTEPLEESEPASRSLDDLFAEANKRLDAERISGRSAVSHTTISDDLFAEIAQPDLLYKEACDLPPMMLFEVMEPVPLNAENASYVEVLDETLAEEVINSDNSPPRLPMETRLTDSSFQTLIFEISGVKMAVPLVELGGIHPFVPLQHIIGKPDWYAGFIQLKGKAINCIDGAKWLLSDKKTANNAQEYQFIIMLNDTNWGIACHNLVDTVLMFKEEVKWRDTDIKRPWMAGLVKEQMCAMLDTYQLTDMLDAGLSSDQK